MKVWRDEDGVEFKNSDVCFGKEFKPNTDKVDIAKISIRDRFPATGWGYLEESHEMAVITNGEGYIETKDGERKELVAGDVVYVEPTTRFCWGGNFDMIVTCGPAFEPGKHHLEDS
jgi:mannose-6-phosphate isomerase-like protein (cupin superfamily)